MGLTVVIIPARFDSTRFPGKPLAMIAGKTMVRRVYEQAIQSKLADQVVVAVDDSRVLDEVKRFGGHGVTTSKAHQTGTDRLAEAVKKLGNVDVIVNVQGDEPFIAPQMIDDVIRLIQEDSRAELSSLGKRIVNHDELVNPNVVKVVWDDQGFALYFSRSPIPYYRQHWAKSIQLGQDVVCYKHIGIYGYQKEALLKITASPQSRLEKAEFLEQLRALSMGVKIKMKETSFDSFGVDMPTDIEKAEKWLSSSL
jgi:3-deoxy-manno-octulosonate cytidylyltransferase (CMP-KDO synthetase)